MYKNSWLKEMIKGEGWEVEPYLDTKGNLTGGIGHLMSRRDEAEWNSNWSHLDKTAYWVDKFGKDIRIAIVEAQCDFGHLPLSRSQIGALAELKFNMGSSRFNERKWPKFYKAMEEGDYLEASYQLLHNGRGGQSKWSLDVKGRAKRVARRVRGHYSESI